MENRQDAPIQTSRDGSFCVSVLQNPQSVGSDAVFPHQQEKVDLHLTHTDCDCLWLSGILVAKAQHVASRSTPYAINYHAGWQLPQTTFTVTS